MMNIVVQMFTECQHYDKIDKIVCQIQAQLFKFEIASWEPINNTSTHTTLSKRDSSHIIDWPFYHKKLPFSLQTHTVQLQSSTPTTQSNTLQPSTNASSNTMLQNRQEKPISPQQMFSRMLSQSYRESQCEDQSQKLKKQRIVLIQLIQEYDTSIQQQILKNSQCDQLERLKLQKLQEIDRLKMERILIEQSANDELSRIAVSQGEMAQKDGLIYELSQVRAVNSGLRHKIRDLLAYVQRLQQNNESLQNQKAAMQLKTMGRMKVNSIDWRKRVDSLQKMHQIHENQLQARVLEKQTQRMKQVRRQQQQIRRRNEARWEQFRRAAFKPSVIPGQNSVSPDIRPFINRQQGRGQYKGFRVI